jgi:hypothetical protein
MLDESHNKSANEIAFAGLPGRELDSKQSEH